MSEVWRLAILFDAQSGDLDGLERNLLASTEVIGNIAGTVSLRIGVTDRHPTLGATNYKDRMSAWRSLDAAIELTVHKDRSSQFPAIVRELRPVIAQLAEPHSVEIVAGPMYAMVPAQPGECFLSLSFRRDPRVSASQFSDWWLNIHAPFAIPILGLNLWGYDQVHLDQNANADLAIAMTVAAVDYDAYDNLTFPDREGFLAAVGDREGMARMFADEKGWIEDASRRRGLMRRIA